MCITLTLTRGGAPNTPCVTREAVAGELESFDRIVYLEGGAHNPLNVKAAIERCIEFI